MTRNETRATTQVNLVMKRQKQLTLTTSSPFASITARRDVIERLSGGRRLHYVADTEDGGCRRPRAESLTSLSSGIFSRRL